MKDTYKLSVTHAHVPNIWMYAVLYSADLQTYYTFYICTHAALAADPLYLQKYLHSQKYLAIFMRTHIHHVQHSSQV